MQTQSNRIGPSKLRDERDLETKSDIQLGLE